jgi:hypothetical protein
MVNILGDGRECEEKAQERHDLYWFLQSILNLTFSYTLYCISTLGKHANLCNMCYWMWTNVSIHLFLYLLMMSHATRQVISTVAVFMSCWHQLFARNMYVCNLHYCYDAISLHYADISCVHNTKSWRTKDKNLLKLDGTSSPNSMWTKTKFCLYKLAPI